MNTVNGEEQLEEFELHTQYIDVFDGEIKSTKKQHNSLRLQKKARPKLNTTLAPYMMMLL
ncbi:MAG: hypothetical protein R3Y56_07245 [Akkermansia sp.]